MGELKTLQGFVETQRRQDNDGTPLTLGAALENLEEHVKASDEAIARLAELLDMPAVPVPGIGAATAPQDLADRLVDQVRLCAGALRGQQTRLEQVFAVVGKLR